MKISIKPVSLRTEAARYDVALRAISAIASMNLKNRDQLKSGLAIFERHRPHLKFQTSKLITLATDDPIFSAAVRRATPDKQAAHALMEELRADPKSVRRLGGVQVLATRLGQTLAADVQSLQLVRERFLEAAGQDRGFRLPPAVIDC